MGTSAEHQRPRHDDGFWFYNRRKKGNTTEVRPYNRYITGSNKATEQQAYTVIYGSCQKLTKVE